MDRVVRSPTPHDRRAIHCQKCQCLDIAGCQPVRRCAIRRGRLSINGTRGTPCDRPFTASRVPEAHIRRRNGPTGLISIRSGARRPEKGPFFRTQSWYRDSYSLHSRCTYHGNLSGWRGVSGPGSLVLLVERHFRTRKTIWDTFLQRGAYLGSCRYCWNRPKHLYEAIFLQKQVETCLRLHMRIFTMSLQTVRSGSQRQRCDFNHSWARVKWL